MALIVFRRRSSFAAVVSCRRLGGVISREARRPGIRPPSRFGSLTLQQFWHQFWHQLLSWLDGVHSSDQLITGPDRQ
jgi:hypothetical protein